MKKKLNYFLSFIFIFLILPFFIMKVSKGFMNSENKPDVKNMKINLPEKSEKELKGIWFSFIEWKKYNNGTNEKQWSKTVEEKIIPNLKSLHINNVFLHATAHSDSFYFSKLYPMSNAVSKEYGATLDYDPFKIFVEKLKENGFKVHAWLNPLRAMTDEEFSKIPDSYQTKKWYISKDRSDYYMKDRTNRYWLNPANKCVRNFISEAVEEILNNFNQIDGIHIDDYFYPAGLDKNNVVEDDLKYYEKIKPNQNLQDFRRNSVTLLVKNFYDISKKHGKIFGISPQGNMENNFNDMFLDLKEIISKGYLNYVMPQIYYGFENETHDFNKSVKEWNDFILNNKEKGDKIDFYVGLAAYKCGMKEDIHAGKGKEEWNKNSDILKRQLQALNLVPNCLGYVFFSYYNFFSPSEEQKNIIEKEKQNLLQVI